MTRPSDMIPISLDLTNSTLARSSVRCSGSCFKDAIAIQDLLDYLNTRNHDKICNTEKDCEKKKSIRIATSTAANVRYIGCYYANDAIRTIRLRRGKEGSIQAYVRCKQGGNIRRTDEISLNYTGKNSKVLD